MVRLSAGTPAFSVIRTAAWHTPLAALRAAVPTWRSTFPIVPKKPHLRTRFHPSTGMSRTPQPDAPRTPRNHHPHTPGARYNPPRPPGRGSVWQSTWFGIRGSQVQILPPRRGPSPRTGSGPEAATASGCFGRIFPRPFPPGRRARISALTHGSKRVYSGALAEDVCPGECPFSCPCFLTFRNRV